MVEGSVAPEWLSFSQRLLELVETDDPRRFFSWDVVQWALAATLLPFIRHELAHLRSEADYKRYWRPALTETAVGRPIPFPLSPFTSGNRIGLAHHLLILRKVSGRSIHDFDVVFEFGGGYGGLQVLARSLGFDGTYIIVDLPVLRALQRFYLDLSGARLVDRPSLSRGRKPQSETLLLDVETIDEAEGVLQTSRRALFVATWSLSEAPQPVRDVVLKKLPSYSHVLVSFQQSFGAIDNSGFFESLRDHAGSDMLWQRMPIYHERRIAGLSNNWYAIGMRADSSDR